MEWISSSQTPKTEDEVLVARNPSRDNMPVCYIRIKPWIESARFKNGKWISMSPGRQELKDVKFWRKIELPY